jgi:hypothetical protein
MAITTAMAVGAAAASAAQAGVSIAQAQKQKKLQQEAEADAAKAFLKAENIVQTQFMEEVQVPLEAYNLEAQTNIAAQRQGIEALSEGGQRSLLGGAGRVAAVGSKASEAARMAMQQDIYTRDLNIAKERQGIRDAQTKMALGEVAGAQQAASDAEYRRMMAQQQALQGIGQALGYGLKATDLYFGMRPESTTNQQPGMFNPNENLDSYNMYGIVPNVLPDELPNQGTEVVGIESPSLGYFSNVFE